MDLTSREDPRGVLRRELAGELENAGRTRYLRGLRPTARRILDSMSLTRMLQVIED